MLKYCCEMGRSCESAIRHAHPYYFPLSIWQFTASYASEETWCNSIAHMKIINAIIAHCLYVHTMYSWIFDELSRLNTLKIQMIIDVVFGCKMLKRSDAYISTVRIRFNDQKHPIALDIITI